MADRDLYRQLFETTDDAVFILRDGEIVDGNPSAAALFGDDLAGLVGRPVGALAGSKPAAAAIKSALATAEAGMARTFAWQARKKTGGRFSAQCSAQPLQNGHGGLVKLTLYETPPADEAVHFAQGGAEGSAAPALRLITAVTAALHDEKDLHKGLKPALRTIIGAAGAAGGGLYVVDPIQQHLALQSFWDPQLDWRSVAPLLPLGQLPFGPAPAKLTQPTVCALPAGRNGGESPLLARVDRRYGLVMPLSFQDEPVGVIYLLFRQEPVLSETFLGALGAAGQMLGLALANAQYVVRLQREIEGRQGTSAALASRIRYEGGLAACMQALWTNGDEALPRALKALRRSIQVDRAYVFENVLDAQRRVCLRLLAETAVAEAPSLASQPAWQERPYHDGLARWLSRLSQGEPIVGQTADLPAQERALLAEQGVRSLAVMPMMIAGHWAGFVGFDVIQKAMSWTEDDQRVLQAAATLIGTFLERRRTQHELADSEARFRRLAEASPDTVLILDLPGRRPVYMNREQFLGYDRDALARLDFVEKAHTDDRDALHAHWRAVAAGTAEPIEYRVRRADGGWEWVQNRQVTLARDADGRPSQVLVNLTVVTDRKKLEAEITESLRRRSQQVALATQIAQEIAAATQLNELYHRVVNRIQQTFGYYYTQLFRYDPSRQSLVLMVGTGQAGARLVAQRHELALGRGLVGLSAAFQRPVLRQEVQRDPDWLPNAFLPETQGELAVPILFGDRLLGVLDIQSDTAGELTNEDQVLLEGLCGQIAIAIETTRLSEDLARQVDELRRLQQLLTREGWQAFESNRRLAATGYRFDPGRSELTSLKPDAGAAEQAGALQSLSIAIRGEVIGSIGVTTDGDRPLDTDDEELLAAISVQVAEALEHARLLQQTQKRAVELETVAQVSTATSTILQAERLLDSVVMSTRSSFGLARVEVYLLDEETSSLMLAAASGDDHGAPAGPVPLHDTSATLAMVARAGEGVLLQESEATGSEILVPMIAGNVLLGVMRLRSDETHYFSPEDMRTHTALALQIAVALQNARRYEEQMRTAEELRIVERLKSQFLANMSHELRTPLNSIIGFSDVLLDELDGPLTPRMHEDVRMIRQSGQHLKELIGDVLDMSKIEAGMMKLRCETFNASEMIADVVTSQQQPAEKKGLELRVELPDHDLLLEADPVRIRQILLNIVSNAVKFTDEGSVTVAAAIEGESLTVRVTDTGIGILPEHVPVIFEEFRQVDEAPTRRAGGTGLGMPISKHLVELHNGAMGVDSQFGEGSTFWFTIPCRQP